jgi:hypothetical protein
LNHQTALKERLAELVKEKTTPGDRSEGKIAGYRDVLATIHASATYIPFTESIVLQLHRDLMQYGIGAGGRWKTTQNAISLGVLLAGDGAGRLSRVVKPSRRNGDRTWY